MGFNLINLMLELRSLYIFRRKPARQRASCCHYLVYHIMVLNSNFECLLVCDSNLDWCFPLNISCRLIFPLVDYLGLFAPSDCCELVYEVRVMTI